MPEWLVELRGHDFDLAALNQLFTQVSIFIVEEKGQFFLKSEEFESLTDDKEVYEAAKEIMPLLNGTGHAYAVGYRNVGMSGGVVFVESSGARKRYIYASVCETIRFRESAVVSGGSAAVKSSTPADVAVKAALKLEVVRRALGFFSQEKTWTNLYRVLDAIREDLGGPPKAVEEKNWVSKAELGRFTGTANNHTAAGGEARHGSDSGKPMSNPMTLSDAENLIRTLLTKWIETRS